eukprot:3317669-Prymnesium_polylepis.1
MGGAIVRVCRFEPSTALRSVDDPEFACSGPTSLPRGRGIGAHLASPEAARCAPSLAGTSAAFFRHAAHHGGAVGLRQLEALMEMHEDDARARLARLCRIDARRVENAAELLG